MLKSLWNWFVGRDWSSIINSVPWTFFSYIVLLSIFTIGSSELIQTFNEMFKIGLLALAALCGREIFEFVQTGKLKQDWDNLAYDVTIIFFISLLVLAAVIKILGVITL